jgi:hypothetical protein
MSSGSSDWKTKLLGKTLGDSHTETSFARNELPKETRVLQPDAMKTMDHKPDRLNVHVDDKGVVRDVSHG